MKFWPPSLSADMDDHKLEPFPLPPAPDIYLNYVHVHSMKLIKAWDILFIIDKPLVGSPICLTWANTGCSCSWWPVWTNTDTGRQIRQFCENGNRFWNQTQTIEGLKVYDKKLNLQNCSTGLISNKIRDLFKVKLYTIRSETKIKGERKKEREKKKEREGARL